MCEFLHYLKRMNLSVLEETIKERLSCNIKFKNNIKQGRPKKEIYDYIIFDELKQDQFLKIEKLHGKEYYIDNENRLYDIISEEYIGQK